MSNSKQVLITYFNSENLRLAYYRVLCWSDRLVKDRFGLHAFGSNLEENLNDLSNLIINGKYQPCKAFKFYEPKPSGTQRTKTLLMVEDALVYQAIANIIAFRNYDKLAEHEEFVFGSVLTPETKQGIELLNAENPSYFFFKFWKSLFNRFKESVIKSIEEDKAEYKFETDITGFFDSIPHYNLLMTLSTEFGVEDEILDLLSVCLNAWSGTKENSTPGVGIPQGPLPSFLLANSLLHSLDQQLISDAFKYYRYIDDIKIYGYSEEELQNVLVLIDNYLKGHGLSINSKKTKITPIDNTKEDATVKELRRFELIGSEYDGVVNNEIKEFSASGFQEEVIKTLSKMAEQLPEIEDSGDEKMKKITRIKNPKKIIEFWQKEIKSVERELPKLFKEGITELKNPEKTDDIDFIRLSAKYGTALRELQEFNQKGANDNLLKYWLFALKKFYWRAGNYTITLQFYRHNKKLKEELFKLYSSDRNYECYRYHLVNCLAFNFSFDDKELRDVFKILKKEKSELVRYVLYCLIIRNSRNQQLLSSIKKQLSEETNTYIKLITLDYWKRDKDREMTMYELIKSIGL